jgi:hypothetical protein
MVLAFVVSLVGLALCAYFYSGEDHEELAESKAPNRPLPHRRGATGLAATIRASASAHASASGVAHRRAR